MAKTEALIQVLTQIGSLQPWVVVVTVTSKKVMSLTSSFSGNMQRELGGNSVHKGQSELWVHNV